MKLPMPLSLRLSLLAVTLFYSLYAALMVWDSSNVINGMRYFALLDDPMISMRYARNLANGLGLVWNEGERVEGITNPGWTFIMALVHLIEPNRAHTSLYIHVLGGLCLIGTALLGARIAWRLSGGSTAVTFITASLSLFYFPANYWGLFGMETSILALMIMASTLMAFGARDRQRFPWASYLTLGLATIVRIDAAVPLVLTAFWCFWAASNKRERLAHVASLACTLMIFVGGQTVARLWYYGLPFPNTYYLKMTGFPAHLRILRGAYVTGRSLFLLLWPVLGIGLIAFVWKTMSTRSLAWVKSACTPTRCPISAPPDVALPILLILGQIAYSSYVGGDAWEYGIYFNRFMIVVFPFIATLAVVCIGNSLRQLCQNFHLNYKWLWNLILAVGAIAGINSFSCIKDFYPQMCLTSPDTISKRMSYQSTAMALLVNNSNSVSSVLTDWAGTFPYFLDRYTLDALGKCDGHIAMMEIPRNHWNSDRPYEAFWPGHMKWDVAYSFDQFRPDFIFLRFGPFIDDATDYLDKNYYLLRDSQHGVEGFIRKDLASTPSKSVVK